MVPTPHGVLYRDSHKIVPTKGGVHKLMILLRDLPKDFLRKFFGEDMRGSRGPRPPSRKLILEGNRADFQKIVRKILYKKMDLNEGAYSRMPPSPAPAPSFKIRILVQDFPYEFSENLPACLPVATR